MCIRDSIRTFIDNHGNTIRTAGSHADIQNAVHSCDCAQVFPAYIDPSVGHVRTQDTSVLGSTLGPLAALGLNFRPVLTCSNSDLRQRATDWAKQVLSCRGFLRAPDVRQTVLRAFGRLLACAPTQHSHAISRRRSQNAITEETLWQEATEIRSRLVCTSTDKATNACSIECKHFYRWVCLERLLSPAFSQLPPPGPAMLSSAQQSCSPLRRCTNVIRTPWRTDTSRPRALHGASRFQSPYSALIPVSYTHLRAHETVLDLVCRLLLEKKKTRCREKHR
eukprot:TRINITY_DN12179_c0_g1_i2.p1 TRINITY_DN12179_c0_g1~~TRINITY_DN12179_c0_g1_i2.p1  ORF type:complete len:279 (-),score=19.01 TRINITY_DN12179_c0_g1_i2:54-890(-)